MHRGRSGLVRTAGLLLALFVCVSLLGGSLAAAAPEPLAVYRRGSCSGPTHWRLVLKYGDPGELIVVYTSQGGASGQKWNVFMENKGSGFFAGSRISGDNGFIRVRKKTRNTVGTDKILVAANNVPTGETCQARASI